MNAIPNEEITIMSLSIEFGKINGLIELLDDIEKSKVLDKHLPYTKDKLIWLLKREICSGICKFTDNPIVCGKETMTLQTMAKENIGGLKQDPDFLTIKKFRNTSLSHSQKDRYSLGANHITRDDLCEKEITIDTLKDVMIKIETIFIANSGVNVIDPLSNKQTVQATSIMLGTLDGCLLYELEEICKRVEKVGVLNS